MKVKESKASDELASVIDRLLDKKLEAAIESRLTEVLERFFSTHQPPISTTAPTQREPEFLSKREVVRVTGLSATTIWRMTRRGEFPSAFHLSANRRGWKTGDVQAWLERRRQTGAKG